MRYLYILILLFATTAYAATDYTSDANCMVALLMESDEDPLTDSSGEGNTAALKGAGEPNYVASAPTGYTAGSYDFDGADDYALVAADATINDKSSFSWTAWVYVEGAGENNLARVVQKNTRLIYDDEDGGGTDGLSCEIGTDGTHRVAQANVNLTHDTWVHVACTYSSGNAPKVYINGSEATYNAQTAGDGNDDTDNSSGLYLGNNSAGSRSLNGLLKEVAMFDDVLTATEIFRIYKTGLDGSVSRRIFLSH